MVKWLNKAIALFQGNNDRFLVLEILENQNRAASIKANFTTKEINVLKVSADPNLQKLLKRFGRLSKYKIVIGLDSHLASTIHSSVALIRDNFKELIDEPELDNLISQAIWKFFDRQRSKVASKMGIADIDILLADVKIRGVKLDGHKVVNPAGFRAKTVEIQFSQTFLNRNFTDSIKELLPTNNIVLMVEHGTAWSNVVAKADSETNFLLAGIFPHKTMLFHSDGGQNGYLDRFNWGEDQIKRSLGHDLAIEPETAALIMAKYTASETSPLFRKRFEALLAKELQVLARGLNNSLKDLDAKTIYLNPFFDLPPLFTGSFRNEFDRLVVLKILTTDLISQNFGFDIKFKNIADSKNAFSILASLLEWYLTPQEDKMSQLAKRRVRWLSPMKNES